MRRLVFFSPSAPCTTQAGSFLDAESGLRGLAEYRSARLSGHMGGPGQISHAQAGMWSASILVGRSISECLRAQCDECSVQVTPISHTPSPEPRTTREGPREKEARGLFTSSLGAQAPLPNVASCPQRHIRQGAGVGFQLLWCLLTAANQPLVTPYYYDRQCGNCLWWCLLIVLACAL